VCLCFSAVPLFSDGTADVFAHPLTAATRARFEAVCALLAEHPITSGTFEQRRTSAALGRTLVSSGLFTIDAKRGMIWDTRAPFASVMIIGADFVTQKMPDGTTQKIDAAGNETFMRFAASIRAVFAGDSRVLRADFTVSFMENGENWVCGLVPRERALAQFAAKIRLSGTGGTIETIVMTQQNGDTVRWTLTGRRFTADADARALFENRR
jgi:hypothetical protein